MTSRQRSDAEALAPCRADRQPPAAASTWRASRGLLALAAAMLVAAVAGWLWPSTTEVLASAGAAARLPEPLADPPDPQAPPRADAGIAPPARAAEAQPRTPARLAADSPRVVRHRGADGDLTPDLADHVNEGDIPSMTEVIRRLHAAGVHTGLGAFSPPGTRPPLMGLAVPEGFPLPEGYVRHYQATDDGQRIEPILMFAPNHPLVDTGGQAMPLPADRVVPPELAPAGMPIRRIELPAPANGSPRRG